MHALVTGGSRGLGPTVARALTREGAALTLTARTAGDLQRVADELAANWIVADLTREDSRGELLERAVAERGPVDILVNNAGIEWIQPYTKLPPDAVETMVRTNLLAPLMLSRAVLGGMVDRRRGHVVMMSSLGGKKGAPYSATYAATKAGLIAWTSALRAELDGTGVGVSAICPGFVSEVGMFAARKERAPWVLGTSTPEAVARAVVRAIQRDIGEIIVNPGPVRLSMMVDALSPSLMSWLLEKAGVFDYYRRRAEAEERSPPGSAEGG
jgi:short-subunit dehydrogenase